MSIGRPVHILWHWITLGPYHFARMAAVSRQSGVKLTVVESTSRDDHDWRRDSGGERFELVSMSSEPLSTYLHRRVAGAYWDCMCEAVPDVIVESGYAELHSVHTWLRYRKRHPEARALLDRKSVV